MSDVGQIQSGASSIGSRLVAATGANGRSFESLLHNASVSGPVLDLGGASHHDVLAAQSAHLSSFEVSPTEFGSGTTAPTGTAWIDALPERGRSWAPEITTAAERYDLDPRLLASLVWTESAFRTDAVSPAGALGLGQLMPGTAAGLGVDPHDPVQNLDGAARYLREQLDTFGRVDHALAAYNAGPGRVHRSQGVPNIAETQAYVRIVGSKYDQLRGAGQ